MNSTAQVLKLKKKYPKYSLNKIGMMVTPPITGERVRQILNPVEYKVCKKHKSKFVDVCYYCSVEKSYPKVVSNLLTLGPDNVKSEFNRLSRPDRTKVTVIQRALLIKAMKDRLGMNFSQISRMLNRDRTSITNLYRKKI